tara:strand:- start:2951 stop:3451 length:501 start_codon:yes stop_codon:yes gene_type:complete
MKNSTKKFIFDLDNTLYSPLQYSESLRADQFYRNLKPDRELTTLLKETKNNYIFTNGNKEHMDECLAKMKIKSLFKPQHTAYNELFGGKIKPHPHSYIVVNQRFKLKSTDTIFYFEDLTENLKTGKKMGWITVYIDHERKMKKKPNYIDIVTDNIYDAITICLTKK